MACWGDWSGDWANTPPVSDCDGPYTGIVGEDIIFDGSGSSDPGGSIVSWDWDFGDGNVDSGEIVTHAYTTADTFTVTLTVTDDNSATDVATCYCTTNIRPVANCGGPYSGLVDMVIGFDGSASTDENGTVVSWIWDFGDGDTGSGEIVSHTYLSAGVYTVTLTVTDDQAATDDAICSCSIEIIPAHMMLGGDVGKRRRRYRPSPEV